MNRNIRIGIFTAIGVGMIIGLLVYHFGQPYLAEDQHSKAVATHKDHAPLTSKEWKAIWGLVALCALNIVFWGVYEQQGNTIQLFADSNTDWHIFGWEMPSTWFQSLNPLFIFILAPLLNMFWSFQAKKKKEPSSVTKMALGCIALGLSFLVLMAVTKDLQATTRINFMWLVGCTVIYTIGELYLSPIGLSLVTKVAPSNLSACLWECGSSQASLVTTYLVISELITRKCQKIHSSLCWLASVLLPDSRSLLLASL